LYGQMYLFYVFAIAILTQQQHHPGASYTKLGPECPSTPIICRFRQTEPPSPVNRFAVSKNKFMSKSIFTTLLFISIFSHSQTVNKNNMTNKDIAARVNYAVQQGEAELVATLVAENYIQHTPAVADGRAGLVALVTKIRNKEIPAPLISNVRVFEDGEFVVLHHDVNWPNKKTMFEIFRFEGGLAAEHWSGIMDAPSSAVNGHTMTDGATEVADRHLTGENKKLVTGFVETVLIKGQFGKIRDFYAENIIQHNPLIDNTVTGLIDGFKELTKQGITIQIEKVVKTLGEGNFVLVCSEGKLSGKPTAFFDLFRVESGKVVEHWDVLQEIPAKSANPNPFF